MEEMRVRVANLNPSVIGVTEIKPKKANFNITHAELKIDGYNLFTNNLITGEGRGCALYIKNNILAQQAFPENDDSKDSVWVEVNLKNNDRVLIGCIYRSNSNNQEENEALNSTLRSIANNNKFSHLLLMGDFNFNNIDWVTWKSSTQNPHDKANRFLEALRDGFYTQHVQQYTRVRGDQEPSVIDLILTNEEGMVSGVETQSPLGKSDHAIVTFNYHCYSPCPIISPAKYQFHRGDFDGMKKELANVNWDETITDNQSIDQQWTTFSNIITKCMDKFIPKSKPRVKSNKSFLTPLDQNAVRKIKKKHRAWTRYMESRSSEHYRNYCRLRSQVTQITRKARKNYEKSIADESKTNPKKFWKFTKDQTRTREGIGNLKVGDDIIEDDAGKARVLLQQFSSVFTVESPDSPEFPSRVIHEEDQDLSINVEEVEKKLKELNVNKSAGPDGIHPRVYRELSSAIALPLCTIFNKSLSECKIPNSWRTATVSPIYKKGNKQVPENYRPVSLTSIASKILESFVREHLICHMKTNNLLSSKQFGFLSGRSTVLQLLTALDKWTATLDQSNQNGLDVIYTDFQKAFDKVPHRRLISKLKGYGFTNNICNWVQDFLHDRKHRVSVNGNVSEPANVTSGIPQGSVLGPVLFVLYINDLPESVLNDVLLFADDTKIFSQINNLEDVEKLQSDIDKLQEWSTIWQLPFHPGKCRVIQMGHQLEHNYDYTMSNTVLEKSNQEKDLGVIVDNKLSFTQHIDKAINKANSVMGIIRRSFKFLDTICFKKLYKSLVRPHLEYAVQVWHPYLKCNIRRIEAVQRRATKQLNDLKDLDYKERLVKLDLPTLLYRRLRGDMIESFKIINGKYDPDVSKLLPLMKDGQARHSTRNNDKKLQKKPVRLDIRKYCFPNRVVDCWNSLPQQVIDAPSVQAFENRLDKYWSNLTVKFNIDAALASDTPYFKLRT